MNKDMEEKPKLRILKEIADLKLESRCALVKKRRERSMLMKLRGGTAAFQVEVGRWRGVKREERICKECQSGEIEDVCHWLLQCPAWDHIRQPLFTAQALKDLPEGATLEQRTAVILSIVQVQVQVQVQIILTGDLHSTIGWYEGESCKYIP